MMGHRQVEQAALFYEFSLERYIPADHLLRSMSDGNTTANAIISPVCDLGNPQPPKRDFEPRVVDRKVN